MAALVALPEWPDPNKLMFRKVIRDWSEEELLSQNGWFPLPDVMKILDSQGTGKYRKILKQREKLNKINQDTIVLMGLKQFGSRIWANMSVFSHWFRKNEAMWLDRIPKSWNFQTFLQQKNGTFSLNRVMEILPKDWKVGYPTLTHLIQQENDPKTEIGADKLEGVGYVVFMPRFGEWLRSHL